MDKYQNIFLIGPMGAGKTAVGLHLSKLLDRRFFDTDQLLMQQHQSNIEQIFTDHGENYFRNLEQIIISKITIASRIILATGGGCILRDYNRDILKTRGLVCYLKASPVVQVARLESANDRPLLPLEQDQRLKYLEAIALERTKLYSDIADVTFDTDNHSVDEIASQLFIVWQAACIH